MRLILLLRQQSELWIGEIAGLEGSCSSGATPERAAADAKARALRILADRLSSGELESVEVNKITFESSRVVPRRWDEYVAAAMAETTIERLEDGTYAGRVPPCRGVVAFGPDRAACERELRQALEDWIVVGLELGHELPVVGGIRLHEPAEANDKVGTL
jgi:predicted RNase H-like HicB family nuclease